MDLYRKPMDLQFMPVEKGEVIKIIITDFWGREVMRLEKAVDTNFVMDKLIFNVSCDEE